MNKLEKVLIIAKVLFSLFISYLVIAKGDAGRLVNMFGSFLSAGNSFLGLFSLVSLMVLYLIVITVVVYRCRTSLVKMFSLYTLDFVLVALNLFGGILIFNKIYGMPIEDAVSKFVILATGSTVLYVLTGVLVLIPIKKNS
ncbi:hypothetical protein IKL64_02200 [bacterium]|nr:hypothetical protein [bacterium]